MRTIDADALKYAIVEEGQRSKRYKIGEFWELNRDELWQVIDAQPTIAWKREKVNKEKGNNVIGEVPSTEAKTKCIAQIKVDTEELVRRIKEEYNIVDGWIPVSDRLPEKDGYYLVSEDDGNIEVEWYDNTGWGYCGVIAWMFLPPPYRKESNDEMVYYEVQREDSAAKDDKRFFNALKPSKEIDRSWGIGMKVPVCPNCEAIISPMCFWKNCEDKVGWCEYCGQKIDWSGWE